MTLMSHIGNEINRNRVFRLMLEELCMCRGG